MCNNNIIIYGKNTITGELTTLQCYNNVLLTNYYERDYLTLNIFGRISNVIFDNNQVNKKILICNNTYWIEPTDINPNSNIGGCVTKSGNLSFEENTGKIKGLNPNKKYLVNAVINLNGIDLSVVSSYEVTLTNADTGYIESDLSGNNGNNFNPNCSCRTTQTIDHSGLGMNMNYVITNCSSFSLLLRMLGNVDLITVTGKYDTNLSISVVEL